MLHETTIRVTKTDRQLADLGVDTEETKFYRFMFDVDEISYHHEHEFEFEEEVKPSTVIFFEDGMQVNSIEPYEKISELRLHAEDENN